MGAVYRFLGLKVGCILHDQPPAERRAQYGCDITYGTNAEFGFDYLRDNGMATSADTQVQRGHFFAIVDEVDSILIDEARTPLIISGPAVVTYDEQYANFRPQVEALFHVQERLCNRFLSEAERREAKQLELRVRRAAFEQVQTLETSDFQFNSQIPRGRIVEIYGPESGGKTTLALQIAGDVRIQPVQARPRGSPGVHPHRDRQRGRDPLARLRRPAGKGETRRWRARMRRGRRRSGRRARATSSTRTARAASSACAAATPAAPGATCRAWSARSARRATASAC